MLRMEVFDKDKFTADDFLGLVEVPGERILRRVSAKKHIWNVEAEENSLLDREVRAPRGETAKFTRPCFPLPPAACSLQL